MHACSLRLCRVRASSCWAGRRRWRRSVSWGVKGGVNLATLSSDQDPGPEFKYRIGLVAGGFFTWPLGAHLDVQPEALFSQQGATFDATGARLRHQDWTISSRRSWCATSCNSSGRGLVFFAGPSLGFKLSAKVTARVRRREDEGRHRRRDRELRLRRGVRRGLGSRPPLDRWPLHVGAQPTSTATKPIPKRPCTG